MKKAHLKKAKEEASEPPAGLGDAVVGEFKGFDLTAIGIPQEAWPLQSKEYKGKLGYTLVSPTTSAAPCLKHKNYRKLFYTNI